MTARKRDGGIGGRTSVRLGVLAAGLLLLAATAYHSAAMVAYRDSAGGGPLPRRLKSARIAAEMEPWNARFRWRVIALDGLTLLRDGRIDDAYRLLEPWAQTVRGDAVYTDAYRRTVAEKVPLDARKAHQQHAKESSAGLLREEDVFR